MGDPFLNYFALFLLIFVVVVLFYAIIAIHDIPYKIAESREHPHQDVIHPAGWISLRCTRSDRFSGSGRWLTGPGADGGLHIEGRGMRASPRRRRLTSWRICGVESRRWRARSRWESHNGAASDPDLCLDLLGGVQGFQNSGQPMVARHRGLGRHRRHRPAVANHELQSPVHQECPHLFFRDACIARAFGDASSTCRCRANAPRKESDVLFRIDPKPYEYVVTQKKAALAEAEQNVKQLKASLDQTTAGADWADAQYELAQQNYDRQAELFQKKVVAQATLDTATPRSPSRAKWVGWGLKPSRNGHGLPICRTSRA